MIVFRLRLAVMDALYAAAERVDPGHRYCHVQHSDGSWAFHRVPGR